MNTKFKIFFTKFLIIIIIFLFVIISSKKNDNVKNFINSKLLLKSFSFEKYKNIYSKYLNGVLPFDFNANEEYVFDEKIKFNDIDSYNNGICLSVEKNYLVPIQYSGVVVFKGDKDNYKNTIIIESDDITIWYSNVSTSLKLYDVVKKGDYLGEVKGDKLYLLFMKDGNTVDYKEYI